MTPTNPIPFDQMCHHAEDSCRVNGLVPVAYRWGDEVLKAFRAWLITCPAHTSTNYNVLPPMPAGAVMIYGGLPVYRMQANGVACIGRREKLLLGIKPFPPPY